MGIIIAICVCLLTAILLAAWIRDDDLKGIGKMLGFNGKQTRNLSLGEAGCVILVIIIITVLGGVYYLWRFTDLFKPGIISGH